VKVATGLYWHSLSTFLRFDGDISGMFFWLQKDIFVASLQKIPNHQNLKKADYGK